LDTVVYVVLGSISWNSISAENFSDKFSSLNFGQSSTQEQQIWILSDRCE
jgi:hypothetical protein